MVSILKSSRDSIHNISDVTEMHQFRSYLLSIQGTYLLKTIINAMERIPVVRHLNYVPRQFRACASSNQSHFATNPVQSVTPPSPAPPSETLSCSCIVSEFSVLFRDIEQIHGLKLSILFIRRPSTMLVSLDSRFMVSFIRLTQLHEVDACNMN